MDTTFLVLSYIWRIFRNLIELAIVWTVLMSMRGHFEITVMSSLGLMYVTIRSIAFGQMMFLARITGGIDKAILHLRHLLNDDAVQDDRLLLDDAAKIVNRQLNKGYVDLAFLSIISLICLYFLLTAPSQ
jgi:hypothetical protein